MTDHGDRIRKAMALVVLGLGPEEMRPFTEEQVEKVIGEIGIATALEVHEALENFAAMVYRLLGREGLVKLLGVHYDGFYRIFGRLLLDRQVEAFLASDDRLESWVGLSGVQAVSLNNGKSWTGTLLRAKAEEGDLFPQYILDTGKSLVDFETLQVADTLETPCGGRVILFDSPHCGVGVPQEREKVA